MYCHDELDHPIKNEWAQGQLQYWDTYRREDDEWCFERRRFHRLYITDWLTRPSHGVDQAGGSGLTSHQLPDASPHGAGSGRESPTRRPRDDGLLRSVIKRSDRSEVHSDAGARSLVGMVVSTAPPSRLEAPRRFDHHALMEMLLGCFLLGAGQLWPGWHSFTDRGPTGWMSSDSGSCPQICPLSLGRRRGSPRFLDGLVRRGRRLFLCRRGIVPELDAGIVVSHRSDRGLLIVQTVAKPLVGRHFEGTSALSYPSGTVTAVAALAAAALLVVPRFAKPLVAVAGGAVVVAVCAAVVVLRWHYPTDALGGVCVGAGAVFAVDGLQRWIRSLQPVRLRS